MVTEIHSVYSEKKVIDALDRGPLGPFVDDLVRALREKGYSCKSIRSRFSTIGQLSAWLTRNRIELSQLNDKMEKFVRARRRKLRGRNGDRITLATLLEVLRGRSVVSAVREKKEPKSVAQKMVGRFSQYLAEERGLSRWAVEDYSDYARLFLSERFRSKTIRLRELSARDISGFVVSHTHDQSPKRISLMLTSLRSFFRFLRLRGKISIDLAACVPKVANWRGERLPPSLTTKEVSRLLAHFDRKNNLGRRNYALMLLLARFGLRACEIVRLTLDDIDWISGEIIIRGKGPRMNRFPLPNDVGEALAAYLRRGRPACSTRRLFICVHPPFRGLGHSSTVSTIVRRALDRTGITSAERGAHLLRHTVATECLRRGASLREIGELLRHRQINTTAIYGKVDFNRLKILAQPWPKVGGVT